MRQLLYNFGLASLFFLLHSCNKKNDSELIAAEYKNASEKPNEIPINPDSIVYKKGFTSYFTYNTTKGLSSIKGSVLGSKYGNFFDFNASGNLLSYKYFINDADPWYDIEYNLKNKVYSEIGSPFEDYFIKDFADNNSVLKYTLHFTSYPRDSLTAFIFVDNEFLKLNLIKSDFMPFLYETEVSTTRKDGKLFIKTSASNLHFDLPGLSSSKTFIDSIPVYSKFSQ